MSPEHRFTIEELDKLAELVAEKLLARIPPHVCVFTPDDQTFVRGVAAGARNVRKTALATTVGALVLGLLAFIGAAVIEWGKRAFRDGRVVTP